jgi:uncharacterized membrane protein AbrB (regulator of aidB expression)
VKKPASHNFTVTGVVIVLGTVAVTGVWGLILLAYQEKPMPEALIAVIAGAISALPSLSAQTRSSHEAQDVSVVNQPNQAVPVEIEPKGGA